MYSTLITAVALFAAPALAAFAVNDPELTQCGTSKISWEKTEGPYNVIAVSAADPCGEPLVEIGDFEGSSIQWKATIPAGTIVQISIADASDDEAWSKNITVAASDDSSCLTSTSVTSTSTTTGSTTGSTTGGSTTSSTTDSTDSDNTDGTTGGGVEAVGAANAGSNRFLDSAAPSARQASVPIMALSAIAAVAALAL
ncbi:hypothetical protein EST38_g4591 [Candolleomyces aberdarensis]|uniref:GPI anchored protein n=1 Tax=Candolleomyces aberdarensis TaxID=2316362 RepID=A0A4Q2DQV9_9AGAR|nr:hypothetical protein EST38_g4591 [Candolleomyces aberdarensis]